MVGIFAGSRKYSTANTTTTANNPNTRPSTVFVNSFLFMGRSGAAALPANLTTPEASCAEI